MNYDNAASRLRAILERGLKYKDEQSCMQIWNELLDTGGSQELLLHRLSLIQALPGEVAETLSAYFPNSSSLIGHWRGPLTTAFLNQQLGGNWATFKNHVPAHVVALLAQAEELLHLKLNATTAREQDLEQIAKMFKELAEAVSASDIPGALKIYVSRGVADLLRAVRDYKYSGATPILRETEALVGHAFIDPEYKSFLTDHELGKRLLDNLNAVAAIFTIAVAVPQIPGVVRFLIGP